MEINSDRLWSRIQALGEIGRTKEGGVTRFAFSSEDRKATDQVMEWMKEAGLQIYTDSIGNIFGRRNGLEEGASVLIGSHIDSVVNGGKFDGVAGVLSALEVIQVLEENNEHTKLPIEMVIFVNEEGSRFPGGLMGSMALAGRLPKDIVDTLKDSEGITLREALNEFGLSPDKIKEAHCTKGKFEAFFELHIEQGVVLEDQNVPVGIVNGIAGPYQLVVEISGRSGHAGAIPMYLRRDPMVVAGMAIQEVERSAIEEGETIRGTVGKIEAFPGGHNIIPAKVEFTVDYRDIDPENRLRAVNRLKNFIERQCKKRKLQYKIITTQDTPPTILDQRIVNFMEETAEENNISSFTMPSGAAHDAMNMHSLCPTGMIFVRSREGLSHCPEEYSSKEDLTEASSLLLHTVIRTANGILEKIKS
ncbi:Zn-dependent hydrolase [Alkalihalobacillus oceani]|uniref:Zn-dependent hydrolase n=1 Tax=Halalkalibacter oceani TaxID=1653776 RepID=UPI00203B34B7|nr:Zn-dependent hydrolase [Halalkalibacter oceani]MCM3760597.1 Zn-dependent hydrolase [Halalkalibacter oceani]